MDEVGFELKNITDEGYLLFDAVGLATISCIPARRVLVKTREGKVFPGVIGTRAGHLLTPEQKSKIQTVAQSYVDIFVSSREEAESLGIGYGTIIVPDSPPTCVGQDGDYIISRAFDDRAPCAVMIETMKNLKREDFCGEIYAVFSVLEEGSMRAILGAMNKYPCEYGLFLDTIPCGDVPDVNTKKELPIYLKRGPVIVHSQDIPNLSLRATAHPKVLAALEAAAQKAGIPYQEYAFSGGWGTEAIAGVLSGEGMATGTIGLPRRYSHSPCEVMHLQDAVSEQLLLEEFLKSPVDLTMLCD